MSSRRPNLLVIGVARAGTSSLFAYLSAHPAIGPARVKEPYYFYQESGQCRHDTLEKYLSLFPEAPAFAYLMEASAGYFLGGDVVARRIRQELDSPRLILVLREPVERALSAFRYERARRLIDPSTEAGEYFEQCGRYLAPRSGTTLSSHTGIVGGLYADPLERWLCHFPDNLRVLFFENLVAEPEKNVNALCSWLSIDPLPARSSWEKHNAGIEPRVPLLQRWAFAGNRFGEPFLRKHPRAKRALRAAYVWLNARQPDVELSARVRSELTHRFAPSNARVRELLAARGYDDFPAWLRSSASSPGEGS